jgi:hypothetical protein
LKQMPPRSHIEPNYITCAPNGRLIRLLETYV